MHETVLCRGALVPNFTQIRQLMTTVPKEITPIRKLRMSLCRYLQNLKPLHKILWTL
jgi:hypothetical protein